MTTGELFKECASSGLLAFLCFLMVFPKHSYANLDTKANLLLSVEHENPKCFAEGMQDLTCFWEEENRGSIHQYRFIYTYEYMNENIECDLTEQPAGGSKTWYICKLSKVQYFVALDICVFRDGQLIHNRSLLIEHVFLLDPPANVTVTRTGQQGQLKVTWQPPLLMYIGNSLIYEVRYATVRSRLGKLELVRGGRHLLLQGLQPDSSYDVWVRVKPEGLSYNGYWSAWTTPVSMATPPPELDVLLLALYLIVSLIIVCLVLALLLPHRRSLFKKLWPVVPSPEAKFPGLFTVYGGDFREWVGLSHGSQWCRPAVLFMGENASPLEVLSEARHTPPAPVHLVPPTALDLPVEDEEYQEARESWRVQPQQQWLLQRLQAQKQRPALGGASFLLDCSDTYVSLDHSCHDEGGPESSPPDDVSEESCPLQILFSGSQSPQSCSELSSTRHSSGSTGISSLSSLEYPQGAWPLRKPSYTCVTLTDSGISVGYSPLSSVTARLACTDRICTNEYKNEIPTFKLPFTGQPVQPGFYI